MTDNQKQILKTDITVTKAATVYNGQTLLQLWNNNDMEALASFYNQIASPVIDLWRPDISASELTSGIVGGEYVALTAVKQNAFMMYLVAGSLNATSANIRTALDAIFGNTTTKTNLLVVAKKQATNFESLFKGAIQGAAYVSTTYGISVTGQDIYQAKIM